MNLEIVICTTQYYEWLKLPSLHEPSRATNLPTKAEFDKTIGDTEKAYMKILESSQVLLNVVKKESAALNSAAEKKPTNNHRSC